MQETIFSTDRVLRYMEGLDAEALAYVRETWPEAELADLRCSASDVLNVRRDERTCAECRGTGSCPVGRHPMVLSAEWIRGRRVYVARAGKCGAPSAQDAEKGAELEKLLEGSGLSERQRKQTFEAYVTKGMGREIVEAKARALLAATEGHWLVLAGNRGTGKSHLAVAIMLEVMKRGDAAMFRFLRTTSCTSPRAISRASKSDLCCRASRTPMVSAGPPCPRSDGWSPTPLPGMPRWPPMGSFRTSVTEPTRPYRALGAANRTDRYPCHLRGDPGGALLCDNIP